MNLIKLGDILKEKRDELGISLRNAGELIGISHNYLSILEKAMDPRSAAPIKPTIDTLKLICDAYNLNINKLLSLVGYTDMVINTDIKQEDKEELTYDFDSPEEAMKFLLEKNVMMGFGGFDIDKLSSDEVVEFANSLLEHLRLLSLKYKK